MGQLGGFANRDGCPGSNSCRVNACRHITGPLNKTDHTGPTASLKFRKM